MIRLKRGHLYDGLSAFDHSIEVDPRYLPGLIDRANVLAMLGQYDDAFRAYHLVLRLHPGYSVAWISLGDVYAHTGRKAEAQECYRKAVADNVDATLAAKLAGFCRSRGWPEAAATNYVEALKLEPINAGLHLAAGRNLMDLKRYGEAADQFREAARLKPESTQPRLLLGLALRQQGRDADALACFEEILRRDPANAPAEEYARPLRAKLGK
jgi:tetratricopeptide (TPR) repeat protein